MMAMAKKKRDPDALTGKQFVRLRDLFGLTQVQMAGELGVTLRTVVRMEASEVRDSDIPLNYAKHVRCLAKVRGVEVPKK